MRNLTKTLLIALLIALPLTHANGQSANDFDFGTWTKVGIKAPIAEKLSATVDLELRTQDMVTKINTTRAHFILGYSFNKYFKVAAAYSPILSGSSVWKHRYTIDATGSVKISKVSLSLRERWQQTFTDGVADTRLRSQLQAKLSTNSIFKPYISVEPHLSLINKSGMPECRFTAGTDMAFDKHNSLQMFLVFTHQPKKNDHLNLGVTYYYSF